jgi:hypothetical protein
MDEYDFEIEEYPSDELRSPEWSRQVEKTLKITRRMRAVRGAMEDLSRERGELEAELFALEIELRAALAELRRLKKQED